MYLHCRPVAFCGDKGIMKKFVVFWLFTVFLLLPLGAYAGTNQKAQKRALDLGFGLGLNIANLMLGSSISDVLSFRNTYEVSVAGFSSVQFHDYVAFQVELRYDRKGTDLELDGQPFGSIELVYVDVPILARPQFPVHDVVTLYGLAGLDLGYLLSADNVDEDGSRAPEEDLKSYDLGLIVGIGASIAAFPRRGELRLDARYERSLIDIDDSESTVTRKNRTFSLFLSYRIYSWNLSW